MSGASPGDWEGTQESGFLVGLRRTLLSVGTILYVGFLGGSWLADAWSSRSSAAPRVVEGTVNIAPSATMVGARLDRSAREVVVRADIVDPDQLSRAQGMTVRLQIHADGVTYENDLTAASSGTLLIGNTVMDAEFATSPPGTRLELRVSTSVPSQLPASASALVVLLLQDEGGGVATCNTGVDLRPLGY